MKLREARICQKNNFSGSKKMFFLHCSYETQRSPDLQKKTIFQALKKSFFYTVLMKLREARICKKKSGSKKMFFLHCSYETQRSPDLPKKQFFRL